MKKIIITGGLGYIGMELSKIYSGKTRNYEVIVIDRNFFSERVSQLKRWGIKYKQIDILNKDQLRNIISDADIIYHLAGITDVGTTKEDKDKKRDKEIREVGVVGTENIIKFSNEDCKIVFPSTHVIFEGLNKVVKNIDENYSPLPLLEYSKGKVNSENDLINSSRNYVILRLGSLYGNSFDSTRLNIMPNLFSKMTILGQKIKLYSGGEQLKSLVSVVDVARCMEFVGENNKIKKEIFNCVNENLTVKEVARICKKINKNLEILSTNDPIPNKGYTLSNRKIKNIGFNFLYNIENSIKEMINVWDDKPLIIGNEFIETGKDDFIDDRGLISNYYFDDYINMIGYVESKKGTVRGNHYHPIQTQQCLLIKGQYISVTKDLMEPYSVVETRVVNEGDLSIIPPNVAHTMLFTEDSVFLNLVNGEREHENYGITHTMKFDLVDSELSEIILSNYKLDCRVCGNLKLQPYLSLGLSPLANNLLKTKNEKAKKYPLELMFCEDCFNSQLSVVVPPKEMFSNYLYLSSTTESFKNHFTEFAKKIKNELKLTNKSLVVDIGSNDGIFLKPLKDIGVKAVGVEPAKNVAKIANKEGLETFQSFFDEKTVSKIINQFGKADLITAFNVFAHSDGLKKILLNANKLLKKEGKFIFEVQYLLNTIKDLTFDNIYHEHVNYWCLLSLQEFFKDSEFKIYKVEKIDTHGGSIRVYSTKNLNKRVHKSVKSMLDKEKAYGLHNLSTYINFSKRVNISKEKSRNMLSLIKKSGGKIIGYGAPAKATTVLNYFGITDQEIEFTIDDNKLKQNKYIPGTNIEILNFNKIDSEKYDYVLVLAWNFFKIIKEKNKTKFNKAKFIKLK
mgnify:CR=1 FL=1|tara:strand:+ start:571 stop:3117 length:2547 start_codon:yes stop_codon:yes gene_type:complete